MSVTLIAYPTATFIDDLTAWNNFNARADADGATAKEEACFDCLYARFAPLNGMPELAYVLDTMGGTDIAVTYSIGDIEDYAMKKLIGGHLEELEYDKDAKKLVIKGYTETQYDKSIKSK